MYICKIHHYVNHVHVHVNVYFVQNIIYPLHSVSWSGTVCLFNPNYIGNVFCPIHFCKIYT